jgi:hypothetical protein
MKKPIDFASGKEKSLVAKDIADLEIMLFEISTLEKEMSAVTHIAANDQPDESDGYKLKKLLARTYYQSDISSLRYLGNENIEEDSSIAHLIEKRICELREEGFKQLTLLEQKETREQKINRVVERLTAIKTKQSSTLK